MKVRTIAMVGALGLVLTGCGAGSDVAPSATVTVTETVEAPMASDGEELTAGEQAYEDAQNAEAEYAESLESDDAAEDGVEVGGVSKFGETVTLPDSQGTITVSTPEPFEPSTEYVEGDWDEFVVMTVTEVNDSDEPTMAGWSFTATSGNLEAEQVFDSEQGIDSPTADIMPGKSLEYKIVFGRNSGEDFVLKAGPLAGWDYAYFQ